MTVLRLADTGEAADLAAFLGRLVRWDKAAVVRLQGPESTLAVFGRPPFGEVLAVRAYALAEPGAVDATVSAGQLLDGVEESAGAVAVPAGVTGPSWAGLLPPRGGWRKVADLGPEALRLRALEIVAEFRTRTEALAPQERTRAGLDALAEEIWSRGYEGTPLPSRAVHAAYALGLLRPVRATVAAGAPEVATEGDDEVALFASGPWLRLRTAYGSVVVRTGGPGVGLTVSPV
ncbi:hypothetical protein K7472_16780 [Streptomyces sp. PTM05]|uniref:Uncharacterized protein n=1 Tax=Streptantibioticus parmotrematis TaxID=2873249 RepID=A0ABS7QTJ3_9ACTN|nr:hypothetical protein [Streptantibioticus parmotrematis]MBY8886508.1 hypothetical protein [Streptantibioticus parmotrematis]